MDERIFKVGAMITDKRKAKYFATWSTTSAECTTRFNNRPSYGLIPLSALSLRNSALVSGSNTAKFAAFYLKHMLQHQMLSVHRTHELPSNIVVK